MLDRERVSIGDVRSIRFSVSDVFFSCGFRDLIGGLDVCFVWAGEFGSFCVWFSIAGVVLVGNVNTFLT